MATKTISIHAAREGGDLLRTHGKTYTVVFQSTPPVKAATINGRHCLPYLVISIHAAREGGDVVIGVCRRNRHVFQSTPPVKAATPAG